MLDDETLETRESGARPSSAELIALTIAFHPDASRIGDIAYLTADTELSRRLPQFHTPRNDRERTPLADPYVSRSAARLLVRGDRVRIEPNNKVFLNGAPLEAPADLDPSDTPVIRLGSRVVLVLHRTPVPAGPALGFIGDSAALLRLRQQVLRVAPQSVSVLIRGETGTGKELVARALHAHGTRPAGPFVAVSLAAIQPSVAAAALFGHTRGAFTGAVDAKDGHFVEADGGTLFADEIGETPSDVQAMLLRALETKEVRPVGGGAERKVDVRTVAATDADLDRAVSGGSFRQALLHRLAGYTLHVPALRDRREDIGRLTAHFAEDAMQTLSATTVEQLVLAPWPGNVRQLRNVVGQLALFPDDPDLQSKLLVAERQATPATPAPRNRHDVKDEELQNALRAAGYRLEKAARALGISRASIYRLIDAHPELQTAKDLQENDLRAAHAECDGDLEAMSEKLKVSVAGIRMRLKSLDLA